MSLEVQDSEVDIVIAALQPNLTSFFEAWQPFFSRFHIIVVKDPDMAADLKIPSGFDVKVYTKSDIEGVLGATSINFSGHSCRYFGYLVSRKKYVISIDDNCLPAKDTAGMTVDAVTQHMTNLKTPATPFFFNTLYDPYRKGADFVRGYPFSLREGVECMLSSGLWLHNADYDPMTHVVKRNQRNTNYVDAVMTVPLGAMMPVSGINVAFNREVLGPVMFPGLRIRKEGKHRWDTLEDIWNGLCAKVVCDTLGYGMKTGLPYVMRSDAEAGKALESLKDWPQTTGRKPKAKAMASSWTLPDHPKLPKGKTVAVIVLDGWGEASPDKYNCIHVAQTPVMDSLKNGAPEKWTLVKAHGTAVGLPSDDDMGNSEVGHNALGAGRIFAQGAKLVDAALASGKIYEGAGFNYIKESFDKGTLHLIGLLSDGGVHSRLDQVQLLLKGASERGAKRIRLHILTDGRDVLDGSSVGFVETIENDLSQLREKGVDARIASGGGRMNVTMDRYENDWDVVKRGWDAQVLGEAPYKFQSAVEAVKTLRAEPKANDQYLPPFVIVDESGKSVGPIVDGDAVVTFNFRADRMVMLAKALEFADFDKFDRVRVPKIKYAGMLQYDGELRIRNAARHLLILLAHHRGLSSVFMR